MLTVLDGAVNTTSAQVQVVQDTNDLNVLNPLEVSVIVDPQDGFEITFTLNQSR